MNSEQLKAYIGVAHYVQQPADWKADKGSVQYIENKPDIDTIESNVTQAQSDISAMKTDIDTIKGGLIALENEDKTIKGDIKSNTDDIATLKRDNATINNTLYAQDGSGIVNRVQTLEGSIASVASSVNNNISSISSLTKRVDTIDDDIDDIKDKIKKVNSNESRINVIEQYNTQERSRIDDMFVGLGDQIVSVGGDVTELNNKVDSLHTKQGSDIAVVQDPQIGQMFYHTTYKILAIYNGYEWIDLNGRQLGKHSGTFGDAPTYLNNTTDVGYQFFDTDKDMNMWWNGTEWVDANGDNL
jgi:predicted  nucleic acid-binding Zn-ribbon protein